MDEEVKKILEDHERRIKALEDRSTFLSDSHEPEKPISIKEFMLSKKPTNDVQKTLAIGYFLEKYEGFSCFNAHDIENGFSNAKEPKPENINLCIIKNIKKGHMMESKEKKDNKKAWVITSSGERFVENGFKKE